VAASTPELLPSGAGLGNEQEESYNMTGLLVVAGIVLPALGAAVDSNARLL